jgi:hypothetical protein
MGMNYGMKLIFALAIYILYSIPMYLLTVKANYDNAFFAFVPLLNIILMINIAGMSGWFVLLYLIPVVNVIFGLYITFKFYASYENGIMVFFILIITSFIGGFIPFVLLLGSISIWWLALANNEFIGPLYF